MAGTVNCGSPLPFGILRYATRPPGAVFLRQTLFQTGLFLLRDASAGFCRTRLALYHFSAPTRSALTVLWLNAKRAPNFARRHARSLLTSSLPASPSPLWPGSVSAQISNEISLWLQETAVYGYASRLGPVTNMFAGGNFTLTYLCN